MLRAYFQSSFRGNSLSNYSIQPVSLEYTHTDTRPDSGGLQPVSHCFMVAPCLIIYWSFSGHSGVDCHRAASSAPLLARSLTAALAALVRNMSGLDSDQLHRSTLEVYSVSDGHSGRPAEAA